MEFDLLVRGATVYTGDEPGRRLDVAVARGLIAAVAPSLNGAAAAELVEAQGLLLCPGFIDMHAHSALQPFEDPLLAPKVAQGFTTEVINPDGLAPAPVPEERLEERRAYLQPLEGRGPAEWRWSSFGEYLDALDAAQPATSLVPSAGHNAVRDHVMGASSRQPDARDLQAMRGEVALAVEAGARTLSFGLIYQPGLFAGTDELVALAREAARFGAPLVPHVRNEAGGVLEAVGEMVEVARRAEAPLHVSHLKLVGNAGLLEPLLELLDRAAQEVDLTFDQYPYGAGSTIMSALLPPWAQDGGAQALLDRLRDPESRARMAADVRQGLPGWENLFDACGPEGIVVAHAGRDGSAFLGRSLAEIAEERGTEPFAAAMDLLSENALDVTMVDHYAEEKTVRAIFRHPLALVGSDGIFGPWPHPRLYGTAARVLGRYAIRERLIPVEDAVARLTSRAADRLRLSDRGRIREGLRADLVLLDPEKYVDLATYEAPTAVPQGVERVLLAGRPVWLAGAPSGDRPGGVVRQSLAASW